MLLQSPPLDSKGHLVCMVCLRRDFFYFHGDCIPKTTTSLGVAINFVTNNDVRTMPAAKTCRAKGLGIGLGFGVRVYGLGSACNFKVLSDLSMQLGSRSAWLGVLSLPTFQSHGFAVSIAVSLCFRI